MCHRCSRGRSRSPPQDQPQTTGRQGDRSPLPSRRPWRVRCAPFAHPRCWCLARRWQCWHRSETLRCLWSITMRVELSRERPDRTSCRARCCPWLRQRLWMAPAWRRRSFLLLSVSLRRVEFLPWCCAASLICRRRLCRWRQAGRWCQGLSSSRRQLLIGLAESTLSHSWLTLSSPIL